MLFRSVIIKNQRPVATEKKHYPVKPQVAKEEPAPKMSSQPPHAALMIPGPIEFDDAVLQSMSHFRYVSRKPHYVFFALTKP